MSLSRGDRFRLKAQLVEFIETDDGGWGLAKQNLLLGEFGLELIDGGFQGLTLLESLAPISDDDLIEMFSVATGTKVAEVEGDIDAAGDGPWRAGYVRLFLSHSAVHKEFVSDVAAQLAVVGIHGFVAHNDMQVSRAWQEQIESALRTMDAFAALIHPEFVTSAWCQQETGWALGRRVPKHAVRIGSDPAGFLGREQWPSALGKDAGQVAKILSGWLTAEPELGDRIEESLFTALANARDYVDAGAASERIAGLGQLTEDQWDRLNAIFLANDQVHGGALSHRALKPFYSANGRSMPTFHT